MGWVVLNLETYQYLQSDKSWGSFATAKRWRTFDAAYNNYTSEDRIEITIREVKNAEPFIRTPAGYKKPSEIAAMIDRGIRLG